VRAGEEFSFPVDRHRRAPTLSGDLGGDSPLPEHPPDLLLNDQRQVRFTLPLRVSRGGGEDGAEIITQLSQRPVQPPEGLVPVAFQQVVPVERRPMR